MCALKVVEKAVIIEEGIVDQFIREVKIQLYLNHPNIVKLYACFDDDKNIYVVLEVAMGGQLYQQLRRSEPMPETKVAGLMKQVCAAVEELHASRVIHRDIKPENIVMHEVRVV
jgi:serine/threonine protein kinase